MNQTINTILETLQDNIGLLLIIIIPVLIWVIIVSIFTKNIPSFTSILTGIIGMGIFMWIASQNKK